MKRIHYISYIKQILSGFNSWNGRNIIARFHFTRLRQILPCDNIPPIPLWATQYLYTNLQENEEVWRCSSLSSICWDYLVNGKCSDWCLVMYCDWLPPWHCVWCGLPDVCGLSARWGVSVDCGVCECWWMVGLNAICCWWNSRCLTMQSLKQCYHSKSVLFINPICCGSSWPKHRRYIFNLFTII